jgi:DNA-binding PadR family transcriptional regulator
MSAAPDNERRAIRSPVCWALLGLVIERPSYGYELLKRFEREYQEHLPISSESHIYRSLDALESRGLIEETSSASAGQQRGGRQPRPCYRATASGVLGYREWLEARARQERHPSALFARELAVLARSPDVALRVMDCCEEAYMRGAARGNAFGASAKRGERDPAGLAERLVSEERRLAVQAALPWVSYARREFVALAGDRRRRPGEGGRLASCDRGATRAKEASIGADRCVRRATAALKK